MSDPVIEDQVFEDYSDPLETIQADYDSLLSDDDRVCSLKIKLWRHNRAKKHPKARILFSLLDMSIICEPVQRLDLWKSFRFWVAVAMWQWYRKPCKRISYSRISYFGHACLF